MTTATGRARLAVAAGAADLAGVGRPAQIGGVTGCNRGLREATPAEPASGV